MSHHRLHITAVGRQPVAPDRDGPTRIRTKIAGFKSLCIEPRSD